MKNNIKLVPFDIEKAKSGAKIVTRDGNPIRILCYDRIDSRCPIVALVNLKDSEKIVSYPKEGQFYELGNSRFDLFIEVEDTYRPYSSAEEMGEAIRQHGLIVIEKTSKTRYVLCKYNSIITEMINLKGYTYSDLLKNFTWLDGSPCGVQEGGENE